jgi:hypothetical protein
MSKLKNKPFPEYDQGQILKQVFNDYKDRLRVDVELSDSANLDAFGRLRASDANLAFESILKYDKQSLLWDETISGSATSTHVANESCVNMVTSTTANDEVVRQTKRYVPYFPGRSQLIMLTGNLGGLKTNVRQRIGYFDAQNGVFFEMDGSTLKTVVRSYATGSAVDTAVNQSSWNIDSLDGNGDSGITLDISKAQIFLIDLEWLGVGRVRYGFVIDGKIVYCHEANHANSLSTVYMTTAKLPCRYEIKNTGEAASSTTMKHICSVVITEGGRPTGGVVRSVNGGNTLRSASSGNRVPLLSLRLASAYNRASLKPLNFTIINGNNADYRYELVLNSTLTGASFVAVDGYAERDISGTASSGGTVIISGYSIGSTDVVNIDLSEILTSIESNIAGTSDILSVVIIPINNTTAVASLDYREVV